MKRIHAVRNSVFAAVILVFSLVRFQIAHALSKVGDSVPADSVIVGSPTVTVSGSDAIPHGMYRETLDVSSVAVTPELEGNPSCGGDGSCSCSCSCTC
jgi:hypothetical protein